MLSSHRCLVVLVPSGPPVQVVVEESPEGGVLVSWQPPKFSHTNGEIVGYVVVCKSDGGDFTNYSVNASQTSIPLTNLPRSAAYRIGVAARTKVGTGIISHMWPVEALVSADVGAVSWWKHVVIGVVSGVALVILCIIIACLCRRQHRGGKNKQRAADAGLVTGQCRLINSHSSVVC